MFARLGEGSIVSIILAAIVALRAWFVGPMWSDDSFVSFAYADRIARGYGPFLPGQSSPYEAFTDPLWVLFFGGVGGLNLNEIEFQAPLSILCCVLLSWLAFRVATDRTNMKVAFFSVLLLAIAPVSAAVRDGGDAVWLALLSLWAASSVSRDLRSDKDSFQAALALLLLSWSGWFGLTVSVALAALLTRVGRWRSLCWVSFGFALLTGLRWVFFQTVIPPFLVGPEVGWEVFGWMPGVFLLAVFGVVISWRQGRPVFPYAVVLGTGGLYGLICGQPEYGFGVALVPAVGVMVILMADAIHRYGSKWWVLAIGLLLVGHDVSKGEVALPEVRTARLKGYFQGRGMGRFLLWRFGPEDAVVVHRPGVVGYYARRPLIDLSGRIHGQPVTPTQAIKENPVAVLPDRKIVSHKAQRLEMGPEWPASLEDRYKQYAIQHQKAWQMVDVDPVWFHLYIRKDLPMLRPDIPKSNGNILPRADPFGSP